MSLDLSVGTFGEKESFMWPGKSLEMANYLVKVAKLTTLTQNEGVHNTLQMQNGGAIRPPVTPEACVLLLVL